VTVVNESFSEEFTCRLKEDAEGTLKRLNSNVRDLVAIPEYISNKVEKINYGLCKTD